MAKKKKILTAAAAVVTAAAIMLGGTFAWQSISQTALNEASDVINPGGRLHDDFNGENKDVYVENFAEEDIYARIRLSEYFEIVTNYGKEDLENREVLLGGEDDAGERTYSLFTGYDSLNEGVVSAAKDADGNSYWSWTTGGSTVYMPTFNMNKDSLAADINGNYVDAVGGISNRDSSQYENYVEYADGEEKTGTEIYDADSNDVEDENTTSVEATHTAKSTESGSLISMAEWDGTAGPYWVYDTDGWVYWAQAIAPDTATGLLLDGISLNQVMDDTWYYAINVEAQFVTADDVGKKDGTGFYVEGTAPTAEAEALLKAIGVFSVDEEAGENGGTIDPVQTETLSNIEFSNGIVPQVDVYRGTNYTFGNVTTGGFPVNPNAAEIVTTGAASYVNEDMVIVIDANEPNDELTLNVSYNGDGVESYTSAVQLNVKSPAEPEDGNELQEALNNGGIINLGNKTFTVDEPQSINNTITTGFAMAAGGTVNGGAINGEKTNDATDGDSYTTLLIGSASAQTAADATVNNTVINSEADFAVYIQTDMASATLNGVNIYGKFGGLLAEYNNDGAYAVNLNNVSITAESNHELWYNNSAVAAANGAIVNVNSGSYTGTQALAVFSSGGTINVYSGTFNGSIVNDADEKGSINIYGGTFDHDPSAYVAEGYEAVDNQDGTWTVKEVQEKWALKQSNIDLKYEEDGTPYIEIDKSRAEELVWNLYGASDSGTFTLSSNNTAVKFYQWNGEGNYTESTDNGNDMVVIIPTSVTESFTVTAAQDGGDGIMTIEVRVIDNNGASSPSDFTQDDDINGAFMKYVDIAGDNANEQWSNMLYLEARCELETEPYNIGLTVFDEEGNSLDLTNTTSDYQDKGINWFAIVAWPEDTAEGDTFTAKLTYTIDNVVYGKELTYTWTNEASVG